MLSRKTTGGVALILAFLFMLSSASDVEALTFRRARPFSPSWSFQVAFDGYVSDDDYGGVRFSLTRHINGNDALRFSAGVYERDNWYDEVKRFETDGLIFTFDNYDPFDVDGGYLSIQYLSYARSSPALSLYWGLGPRFSVEEARPALAINETAFPYHWVEYVDCTDSHRIGFGLEGSLGMELFLGRRLSLNAEYTITMEHRWYHFDMDYYDGYGYQISEDEFVGDGFHLDASHIRLGVSMYF